MSIIEASITVDADGDFDSSLLISQINDILLSINNKETQVNIIDMDNPISTNPLNYSRG